MLSIKRVAEAIGAAWRFLTGEAEAAREAISRVFEDNFDGLAVIGEDGRIIAASRVASQLLLGAGNGNIVGRVASDILPEPILRAVQQAFAEGRRGVPSPMALAQIGDLRRGGYIVQYVVNLSELDGPSGPLPRRVVHLTFWDETERRQREEELVFVGTHDHVTGALTRGELVRIVNAALSGNRSRAVGLSILLLDLSRFKALTLEQTRSDALLKLVVSRIRAAGIDSVARLAGDRFAMVRYGRLLADEMRGFCEKLIERLVLPYALGGQNAIIGVSIGFTHTDLSGYDPEVLMSHADVALEAAKDLPGNSFCAFTPEMDRRLKEHHAMDIALRQARGLGQLSIIYQPQCALEGGVLVGVEALVRWAHPELGIVSPERFIPAAEENGEIVEIGRWVLQEACREAAGWPFQTRLAVNVSPVQFEFVDIVAEVKEALSLSGLPAHRLDLEITEGMLLAKASHIVDTLRRLRELGVGIALDDFGTGYSSLSYLGRLPVDKIKIDRSFIASLPGDAEASAIVRAVMTLSETLNKVVIAEGVEAADQAWMLRMMGCRIGQGHYFGRARSGSQMAKWFEDGSAERAAAG
jgi:diguanylate cyclase (GGDEF)-like protein